MLNSYIYVPPWSDCIFNGSGGNNEEDNSVDEDNGDDEDNGEEGDGEEDDDG